MSAPNHAASDRILLLRGKGDAGMVQIRVSNISCMNETVYSVEEPSSAGYDTIREALRKAVEENIFNIGDTISIEDDYELEEEEITLEESEEEEVEELG